MTFWQSEIPKGAREYYVVASDYLIFQAEFVKVQGLEAGEKEIMATCTKPNSAKSWER